ncbi:MAG: cobalamin-independent methionine synthase II family protein [Chloroflexota bacterium]|nr:cobalamin-independent methionine synthase II family protein [Chloroflexota bacterium]
MKRSTDRILTTHCGSLPRPKDLLDLMKAKIEGKPYDEDGYAGRTRSAVAQSVREQAQDGIDVVTDGEQGKPGFFTYVTERLTGFQPRGSEHGPPPPFFPAEVSAFPEYYEQYFRQAMLGGSITANPNLVCTGPVRYRGQDAIQRDVANLKAALAGVTVEEVFVPSVAPSGIGRNLYYASEEEYLLAVAEAMRDEYQAIVEAGFILQLDDPWLSEIYSDPALTPAERRGRAEAYAAAVNHGLRGIAPEKVRLHTCYGINEGPRVHDASLADVLEVMLAVNAGAYSFEAANPRHEHEYHVWEQVKLPEGKLVIPGVITHASNIVEHPKLVAERLVRYAERVGRENVIAGADCGFSSQASYNPEVHPTVIRAKFQALAEGAKLATKQLWG